MGGQGAGPQVMGAGVDEVRGEAQGMGRSQNGVHEAKGTGKDGRLEGVLSREETQWGSQEREEKAHTSSFLRGLAGGSRIPCGGQSRPRRSTNIDTF